MRRKLNRPLSSRAVNGNPSTPPKWDSAYNLGPILHSALLGLSIPLSQFTPDQLQEIAKEAKRLRATTLAAIGEKPTVTGK